MSPVSKWYELPEDSEDDDDEATPKIRDFLRTVYRDYQEKLPPMAKRKFERSMRGKDYSYESAFVGSALEFVELSCPSTLPNYPINSVEVKIK